MILSTSAPNIARNQLRAAHSIGNKPLNGLQVLSTLDLKKSRQESSWDKSKNGLSFISLQDNFFILEIPSNSQEKFKAKIKQRRLAKLSRNTKLELNFLYIKTKYKEVQKAQRKMARK